MIIWLSVHLIIWSWDDHMIIWSCDPMIIWSHNHMILWLYDQMIIWSYDHRIIWSYDHMIISWYDHMIAETSDLFLFQRRKIKCRGSSETCFGKVSGQSELSSGGNRPIKIFEKVTNFWFFLSKNEMSGIVWNAFWQSLAPAIFEAQTVLRIFSKKFLWCPP